MSHWHSGLPKLDIQPFDPSPLYDAVKTTSQLAAVADERRRTSLRTAGVVSAVLAGCALVAAVVALVA